MKNYIFFNPSEWTFNPRCGQNVGGLITVDDFEGMPTIGYRIGDWNFHWTEIMTDSIQLEKNTEYSFVFWLNGGENSTNNEVCQVQIISQDDWESRKVYLLNHAKPLLYKNGWKLFEINFKTDDSDYYELRFVVSGAVATITAAKELDEYEHMTSDSIVDETSNKKYIPNELATAFNKISKFKKPLVVIGSIISSIFIIKKIFKKK